MRVLTRRPTTRHEVARVFIAVARATGRRTTIVLVGRDLAFDARDE